MILVMRQRELHIISKRCALHPHKPQAPLERASTPHPPCLSCQRSSSASTDRARYRNSQRQPIHSSPPQRQQQHLPHLPQDCGPSPPTCVREGRGGEPSTVEQLVHGCAALYLDLLTVKNDDPRRNTAQDPSIVIAASEKARLPQIAV